MQTARCGQLIRSIVWPPAALSTALILCSLVFPAHSRVPQSSSIATGQRDQAHLEFSANTNSGEPKSVGAAGWSFEPNVGQLDRNASFVARAQGASIFLTRDSLYISWPAKEAQGHAGRSSARRVRIEFAEANRGATASGERELPGKTNYLLGYNRSAWRLNVPHYSSVRYADLYPGVDARIYGGTQGLEYDLTAAQASAVSKISLRIEGAKLSLNSHGDLQMRTAGRTVVMKRPHIYQMKGRAEAPIAGEYRILPHGRVRFTLGAHDPKLPIVIDPILSVEYTTFLGGAGAEKGNSVAVDAAGKIYVGGETTLPVFPADSAPGTLGSATGTSVLFVAKLDPTQSGAASLDYLTFIGGSGTEKGGMVAVDNSAVPPKLAVLGWTTSADFPVTNNSALGGPSDLTVTELDGTGSAMVFSKYLGGTGTEASQKFGAIAADSAGDIFVASDTTSADFPITSAKAVHSRYGGGTSDGILAELAPGSSATPGALVYSTYLGINAQVGVTGVAVDASQRVYISGFTSSPIAFPSVNPFQANYAGGAFDGFVMEINPSASGSAGLVYSSLLGGSDSDQALSIRVDAGAPPNAYVVGTTQSPDLVSSQTITNPPYQAGLNGSANGFVAVINQSTGKPVLQYLSYLGGTKSDQGRTIAVVSSSQIYVAGTATSSDFPVLCPLQSFSGNQDAFVTELNPTVGGTSSLLSITFLGGTASAEANGVAADSVGDAIVFGDTASADFPLAGDPQTGVQPICASCQSSPAQTDAFLTLLKANTNPAGCVAFNPSVANLGSFGDGTNSPPLNILVTNSGNAALNVTGMTVTGANAGDFVLSQDSCLANSPIAAGGSCAFSITFAPSVIGLETASLQVTDDGIGSPQTLDLRGTGTGFGITLNPASVNFPDTSQGQTDPNSLTVTLTNAGSDNLSISPGPQLTGANATDFVIGSSSTCTAAALPTLLPGGMCTVVVEFAPNESNPPEVLSAEAVVTLQDPTSQASESVSIPLSGTEIPVAPAVALSPVSLNFNSENVGSVTPAQTVSVTNDGSAPLAIASVSITGANAGDFAGTNSCPLSPVTLAAGANCTISAKFQPSASGQRSAAISLADNASGSPQSIPLTGTGTAISASLTPSSLAFSAEDVGSISSPLSVTLQNTGSGPLTISSVSFTGTNAPDFSQKNNCPAGPAATLAAGLSCTIDVTFDPTGTGSRAASLAVTDDAASSPQTIALVGVGTAPALQFSALSVQFGATLVGTSAGNMPVQVSNSGNGPLVITQVGFSGANAADFQASGTCVGASGASVTVGPGSVCEIDVDFKPTAAGNRSALLSVTDNAAGSPQQVVQLSGTATDFELEAAAGGGTSVTIDAGQTATFNLQVASVNGFSGTPSLSCTSSIPAASCSLTPAQVTVAPNQNAPFSVTLPTTSRSMGAPLGPDSRCPVRIFIFLLTSLVLLRLILFWRTFRGQRLVAVVALSSAILLCSCGSTASSSVKGTPAGNYTLTVTGAISSTTRTVNLSVTVR